MGALVLIAPALAAQYTLAGSPSESQVATALLAVQDGEAHHTSPKNQGALWAALAISYQNAQHFREAGEAYDESLRLLDRDPAAKEVFATTLDNLASLYLELGALDQARAAGERVYRMRKSLGVSVNIAASQEYLAEVELASHRYAQAAELASKALLTLRSLPTGPVAEGTRYSAWITLAFAKGLRGQGPESLRAAEEAFRMVPAQYPAKDCERAKAFIALGLAQWKTRAVVEADGTFREGLRLYREDKGETSPYFLAALREYRTFLSKTGTRTELAAVDQQLKSLTARQSLNPCPDCSVSIHVLK